MATCRRIKETKRKKKGKSQTVIFRTCAETSHADRSLPYLEAEVGSRTQLRTPSFMAIGLGILLPAVAENPTFPILSALAYTTGLGYRPTCDKTKYDVRSGVSCLLITASVRLQPQRTDHTIVQNGFLWCLPYTNC